MSPSMLLNKRVPRLVFAILFIALLPGCAGEKGLKKESSFDKWKARAENSKAFSPSAKALTIDLPERLEQEAREEKVKAEPERPLPTERVTMAMRNTDVNVILRALARAAGQNIMMNDQVKGITNVNVKETPWDQVFLGILHTRGLAYTWEGDIIRVMTLEDMKHARDIEEIQQKRKAQRLELKRVEPLLTRIIQIDYADAKSLSENLQTILTKEGKDERGETKLGSVTVDEHNNALLIHAIRDDIAKMIALIEKLDRPTPQILIDANIVETNRDTAWELGIQWGGLYHRGDYWITPGANTGGVTGQSLTLGIDPTTGIAANFPADLSGGAGLTLGYVTEEVGRHLLNVQLSALEEDGKLNILSSPSITTLDNQPAVIESGAEVPFQTIDNEGNIDIEWKKAVLKLEVTPHVVEQKLLKMKIITSKDELDFNKPVQGNPTIITKRAETNVILLDGQTTVIGGLTKETTSGTESGVPGLKDIPILGYIFKAEGEGSEMEEVLIFITPHILKKRAQVKDPDSER